MKNEEISAATTKQIRHQRPQHYELNVAAGFSSPGLTKYMSYDKMLGQLPQSCTGRFRKMLTIGTIFLHHLSKTLSYQILQFLPLQLTD